MFSLRSNSIESRFTRFLGQFFGYCFRDSRKSKSKIKSDDELAMLVFFEKQKHRISTDWESSNVEKAKAVFQGRDERIWVVPLVDTRS